MAKVIIIGDGPGGLSAALFLAKNDHEVVVYALGDTMMHYAYLYNYLGIDEISGTDLQARGRNQVERHGAALVTAQVDAVAAAGDGFQVTLEDGTTDTSDYVILSEGKKPALGLALGLDTGSDGRIEVDRDQKTSMAGVYAVGRATRLRRSQAIISAGAGASAALDILAIESGGDVEDWDEPPAEG